MQNHLKHKLTCDSSETALNCSLNLAYFSSSAFLAALSFFNSGLQNILMLLMLEFNFVSLASISFLRRAFSCCNSAIVLSPMFNGSRGELGVGDEAPIEDSLDAGLNFGEWFSSGLNEYILDQLMIYKPFWPCNTPAPNAISQATEWTHIDI